jgi:AraC-like DNA-binding protein
MPVARPPRGPLLPFVRLVWFSEAEASHALERVLPTGAMHVVVRLDEVPLRLVGPAGTTSVGTAIVGGARSSAYVKEVSTPARSVGAVLQADAALPLLGVPAGELAERHVDLLDLWGAAGRTLRERLQGAPSPEAALEIFEVELAHRLPAVRGVHPLVAHALARLRSDWPLASVVRESGYSHRRVSSVFREAVGLAPKVWCRVQRFQRAVAAIAAGRPLADVASGCGYADQSHLTREFGEIAGLTPSAYRAAAPARENHVPISDSSKTGASRRRRFQA